MWDEPTLLRNISSALFALSLLLVVYGAAHYLVHMPQLLPLHQVSLNTAPLQVDEAEVLQVLRERVQGNLFTVDIERLKSELEKLPWVRGVQIRREFPDRLSVEIEEHQALAHWNEEELVNQQGEVFSADSDASMPSFVGQTGDSALVTQQYAQFTTQLSQVGLHIQKMVESPRRAWQLCLDNGMVLELGSEQMQQRLDRFVTVYPYSLATIQGGVKTVDLRYHNGFAVSGLSKQI
jgi:cell division protein FtsQ